MKLNKTTWVILAVAGLLSCSMPSNAQSGTTTPPTARPGMGRSVEAQMSRLSDELKLTNDQKPKVKTILEERNKKVQELRTEGSFDRSKMQALQKETSKKMKEILTEDQLKKYEEFVQQQRNRRQDGGAGAAAAPEAGNAPKASAGK